jgi:hypothetical protein
MVPDRVLTATAPGDDQDASLALRIPRGDAGTDLTIAAMRALAWHAATTPDIEALAAEMYREGDGFALGALWDWAKREVHFKRDPRGIERVQSPELLLRRIRRHETLRRSGRAVEGEGDCDCVAPLYVAVMLALGQDAIGGAPAFVVVGREPAPAEFEHVFAAVIPENIRPVGAEHFTENQRPARWKPFDPQETRAFGQIVPSSRLRVYPALPEGVPWPR